MMVMDEGDVRRFDELAVAARADAAARARLVGELEPWLRRWARRYRGGGVAEDDLLQDAVVGVLRAVNGFDPARGPFLVWVRLWVRQALQQAVAESARVFRLPTHVLWEMHELKEARERLLARLGRPPRLVELADALGWGADRVADVLRAEQPADGLEGVDLPSYGVSGDDYERVLERVTAAQLQPLLLRLSDRERMILEARAEGESLRTIGRRLGVSGERVRMIEERALARLRVAAHLGVDTSPKLLTQEGESTPDEEDLHERADTP